MREEEVPGGLEVLEGAELDDGAGHGSEAPGSGARLPWPRPAPCHPAAATAETQQRYPGRGGATEPEAVSTRGPSAPEPPRRRSAAPAPGPRHVTPAGLGSDVNAEVWGGRCPGARASAGKEAFYPFWLPPDTIRLGVVLASRRLISPILSMSCSLA